MLSEPLAGRNLEGNQLRMVAMAADSPAQMQGEVTPEMETWPILRPDLIPLLSNEWLLRSQAELVPLVGALQAEVSERQLGVKWWWGGNKSTFGYSKWAQEPEAPTAQAAPRSSLAPWDIINACECMLRVGVLVCWCVDPRVRACTNGLVVARTQRP